MDVRPKSGLLFIYLEERNFNMLNLNALIWMMAILIISYLIGSVNTSIIAGKIMAGIDVREHGSGNAGATNALRTLGKKGGLVVVLGDCFKAIIACILGLLLASGNIEGIYIAGIGTALGHNFPIYFKFKGGKGVLVSLVAIIFSDWKIGLCVFIVSMLIIIFTRYVSLGSICGAILFVILAFIFKRSDVFYISFAVILAVLSVIMHRGNIVRLIKGTENRLGQKKE